MSISFMEGLLDVTGAETVEVQVRHDGEVLWVNVDGRCRLRVCQIKGDVMVNDERPTEHDVFPADDN